MIEGSGSGAGSGAGYVLVTNGYGDTDADPGGQKYTDPDPQHCRTQWTLTGEAYQSLYYLHF